MINICISFLKINRNNLKKRNKNMINTCFPEEENNKKKLIFNNINTNNININTNNIDDKPLYTLIWYD